MAFNEMSLPIDIPWKRMGVSEDMIDPIQGDLQFPKKWHSSIAVFYHEPTELPPEYCNRKITYLKIACTITNYDPFGHGDEVTALENLAEISSPYRWTKFIRDNLAPSLPCYGALLQVGVYPNPADGVELHDFPYISSFEPRKREMYETVTESGEVLSQSANYVNIGKQMTGTSSFEDYELDTGSSSAESSGWREAGAMGVYDVSGQRSTESSKSGQWGTIARNNRQDQRVSATDTSREKRESFSHSTSLNHIYSLLQGYHIGTNRALFFMQPRPHIQDSKFTFIQGPRRLEGIQEFFLIINRPASVPGFCVDVALETAHINTRRDYRPRLIPLSDLYIPGNLNKTADALGLDLGIYQYYMDLVILWNYTSSWVRHLVNMITYDRVKISELSSSFVGDEGWTALHNLQQVGKILPDIGTEDIALIFEEYEQDAGNFFVLGRRLEACAMPDTGGEDKNVDIERSKSYHLSTSDNEMPSILFSQTYDKSSQSFTREKRGIYLNSMSQNLNDMFRSSINSPDRFDYGKVTYYETEFVLDEMSQLIRFLEKASIQDRPLDTIEKVRPFIEKGLGQVSRIRTVLELGNTTTSMIARDLNVSELEARKIRSQLLRTALNELDLKTIKEDKPLVNPIRERFEREYPKERLDKLIQSAYIREKAPLTAVKKSIISKIKEKVISWLS